MSNDHLNSKHLSLIVIAHLERDHKNQSRLFGPGCIGELSLDCFSGLWWEHSPPSQHCWLTELLEACQILSHHLTKEVYRAHTPARVCTFFQLQEPCQQTLTPWHEPKMALYTHIDTHISNRKYWKKKTHDKSNHESIKKTESDLTNPNGQLFFIMLLPVSRLMFVLLISAPVIPAQQRTAIFWSRQATVSITLSFSQCQSSRPPPRSTIRNL